MIALLLKTALGATLTVGPTGEYPTLTEAVAAASAGDTLEVQAGEYAESLVLTQDLTIVGLDGAGATTIHGPDTTITAAGIALTLRGISLLSAGDHGLELNEVDLTLEDVAILGVESASSGGCIVQVGGSLSASALTLSGCTAEGKSGGLLYASAATVDIRQSTLSAGSAERGGAVLLTGSTATFTEVSFQDNQALPDNGTPRGGAIRAESSTLTLVDSAFADNVVDSGFGGAISAYLSTLTVQGGSFTDNTAAGGYGGALVVWDSAATVEGTTFAGNQATDLSGTGTAHGGAIYALGDDAAGLGLTDVTLLENLADSNGGGLRVSSGPFSASGLRAEGNLASSGGALYVSTTEDVTLSDSSFTQNAAGYGGALRWKPESGRADLTLSGVLFEGNTAEGYGGALYAYDAGTLTVEHTHLLANSANLGGALMLWGVDTVAVTGSLFCGNTATPGAQASTADGGAVLVYQGAYSGNRWTNNVFVGNQAASQGGALKFTSSGDAEVINNHLLGGSAEQGAALLTRSTDVEAVNNLIAWNTGSEALSAEGSPSLSLRWSDLWQNEEDADADFQAASADGLAADPLLMSWSGDCAVDQLAPRADSPLRDAGDPTLSDPDGSRSDIGAYGGPDADAEAFTDLDGDGWAALYDCDDQDPEAWPGAPEAPYDAVDQDCDGADLDDVDADGYTGGPSGEDCDDEDPAVHPGATETWYDGVDQDCDDADDADQDGDGFGSAGHGGEDCDDLDPAVHPDAVERAGDAVDSDCDGRLDPAAEDDTGLGPQPKRCATTEGPGGAALALLGAALLARRRRTA